MKTKNLILIACLLIPFFSFSNISSSVLISGDVDTPPCNLSVAISSQTNVMINGGSTGTATANAWGGIGAVTYSWSNGQTSAIATNLSAGTYTVTVTDAFSCTSVISVIITEPAVIPSNCTTAGFEWVHSLEGAGSTNTISVNTDTFGNIYTIGHFNGTVDFDHSSGTFNLTSNGANDVYISKLDAADNFVWAKSLGGGQNDLGYSITTDASGSIYVTGTFRGTSDFDPSNGTYNLTSNGNEDIFICKLDSAGSFIWAKSMGAASGDVPSSITTDLLGNIYTSGQFGGTVDFDPGSGIHHLISNGSSDIFISKLDSGGNFVWAKSMGGGSLDGSNSITTDALGNIYTTGDFRGTVDFDPGSGTYNVISNGGADIFISKLDSGGNFVWAKSMGGISSDQAYSITTDTSGNVYSTGAFNGTVDFDPGNGVHDLISNGSNDIFISKLDSGGNFVWAKSIGGTSWEYSRSITTDTSGDVYVTGFYRETVDFDPGNSTYNLTSNGLGDIFINKLDSGGNFVWAKSIGGANNDVGQAIITDVTGSVYIAGYFEGLVDFDPGAAVSNLNSVGGIGGFLLKLTQCAPPVCATTYATDTQVACDSLTWIDGLTYTSNNNTATHTLTNAAGCDSIVTLSLTIHSSPNIAISSQTNVLINGGSTGSATVSVPGSVGIITFDWSDGQTTSTATSLSAGTYTVTVTDAFNCSSTETVLITEPSIVPSNCTTAVFDWAHSVEGASRTLSVSVTADAFGNIYTIGHFNGTVDFDPGNTTFNLTSSGQNDIYISKLDASGNFIWARSIGGGQDDLGYSITTDASGGIYVTGTFRGSVDFDPGNGTYNLNSNGESDIFICKLDSTGSFVWAKSMGSTTDDISSSITTDHLGNIYTTGGFSGTVDFDPGSGTYHLISNGSNDIFISKLDSGGNFLWAKSIGGGSYDASSSITTDALGNVYLTGNFRGTVDFDPGSSTHNLISNGGVDIFVSKLDSGGNFIWGKSIGAAFTDQTYSITLDTYGDVYLTGVFNGTVDFDPGSGVYNLISNGESDVFICKLDSAGNFVWAKSIGGTSWDSSRSITTDEYGNVYISGTFMGTVDFNPGSSTYNLISNGTDDIFISKLDSAGNFVWAKSIGGVSIDVGQSVIIDAGGRVYAAGYFKGIVDFDPGTAVSNLSSVGRTNGFLLKLSQCPTAICATTYATDTQTSCDSLIWMDGLTYTSNNNTAIHTLTNAAGCDSIVTLNLTIHSSPTATISSQTNVLVNGQSTGSAAVSVSGGSGSITYNWSNAQTTSTATNLPAGTFTVTVTDANSCTGTTSVSITQPQTLSVSIGTQTPETCSGSGDGAISLTVVGGQSPYTYSWNNGAVTQSVNNLGTGYYAVTVEDANGTRKYKSGSLAGPDPLWAFPDRVEHVGCTSLNSGEIELIATGGTPGFIYTWSNGSTSAINSGLISGNYDYTVTDAFGCEYNSTITIENRTSEIEQSDTTLCQSQSINLTLNTNGGKEQIWNAIGNVVIGEDAGDYLGNAVATSYSGNRMVVGSFLNNDQGNVGGQVQVFDYQNNAWTQIGQDIEGLANTALGYDVDISGDGNRIIIGAPGNSYYPGKTYVMSFNGSVWTTLGSVIYGTHNGEDLGRFVSISGNGNMIAYTSDTLNGVIQVKFWNGSNWQNQGSAFTGNVARGLSNVELNHNGSTVSFINGTSVEIYNWIGGNWVQKGSGVNTLIPTGRKNSVLEIDSIGDNFIIGGSNYLNASVYHWSGSSWDLEKTFLDSNTVKRNRLVTMSNSGNTIAFSTYVSGQTGKTLVYSKTNGYWKNLGEVVYGVPGYGFGYNALFEGVFPALNGNGTRLVIGSPGSSLGGSNSGQVKSYELLEDPSQMTYLWSNGSSNSSSIVTPSTNSYYVTVTNGNLICKDSVDVSLGTLQLNATPLHIQCNGSNTGSISVSVSGGSGSYSYLWNTGGTTANLTNLSAGTYSVTVTDVSGCNQAETITITEPTALISTDFLNSDASCISSADGDAGVTVSGGVSGYSYLWTNGATTNNPTNLGVGKHYVTITDNNLCMLVDSVIIGVNDVIDPVVVVQNITVYLDGTGNASISTSDIDNGSSDNCGVANLSLNQSSFTCNEMGNNTVTLTVTDASSNSSTGIATVTVLDTISPTVTVQNALVYLDGTGNASISTSDIDNGSSDNCGVANLSLNQYNFTCNDIGINTVILTVADASSNSSTGIATVTVLDTISPTVRAQNITVYLDGTGNASISTSDINNGSSDNCGVANLSLNQSNFTCTDIGANTVTLTVTDVNSNSSTGIATVTVLDTISPTVTVQNVTTYLDATGNASISTADIHNSSSDNCGAVNLSLSQSSFTCTDIGVNTVTLSVTDASSNSSTGIATVTVLDTVSPTVTVQNITVYLDGTGNASISTSDIDSGSSDNCGVANLSLNQSNFTCNEMGNNTVALTVTDASSNSSKGIATVTVLDTVSPTVRAQNITVYLDGTGNASISTSDINNGSSDNCGIASLSLSQSSFICTDIGANTVTLTVTDVNSNSSTGIATVMVLDTISPTVAVQNALVYLDGMGNANISTSAINYGSSDNCGIANLSLSQSSFTCSDIGINSITLTVTDASSNSSTGIATVTVLDTVSPTVTVQNITVYLDGIGNASISTSDIDNGSSDNCGVANLSLNQYNFTCNDIGINTVILTVADASSNSSTGIASVTVLDTISPTVGVQNAIIYLDVTGNATLSTSDINNGSSDNCGIASLSLSQSNFTCNDIGTNTVALTVTDASSNSSLGIATVTVLDTISPTVGVQNAIVYLDVTGNIILNTSDINNNSIDNCGVANLSLSQSNFTCNDIGTNTVTLTVTDASSNSSSGMTTVTVMDTLGPILNAQNITGYLDSNGVFELFGSMVDLGSTDNCQLDSVFLNQNVFDCGDLGTVNTWLYGVDIYGNIDSVQFQLVIEDVIAPSISCASDTSICAGEFTFGEPTGWDNCGFTVTQLSSFVSGNVFAPGVYTFQYQVVDNSSNVATCSYNLKVDSVPVVNLGNDTLVGKGTSMEYLAGLDASNSYLWNDGSTDSSLQINVYADTTLWVEVIGKNGCAQSDTVVISVVLGVETQAQIAMLKLYPNPAHNDFVLSIEGWQNEELKLTLTSIEGKVVSQRKINHSTWKEKIIFDSSQLARGVYFMRVSDGVSSEVLRIVLQ